MVRKLATLSLVAVLGCMNPNTGSNTTVGESVIWPEVSDSSDSVSVRVFKSLKGAQVWVAKDSVVEIEYDNAYTNSYFGAVYSQNALGLKVKVKPVQTNSTQQTSL